MNKETLREPNKTCVQVPELLVYPGALSLPENPVHSFQQGRSISHLVGVHWLIQFKSLFVDIDVTLLK